MTENMCL